MLLLLLLLLYQDKGKRDKRQNKDNRKQKHAKQGQVVIAIIIVSRNQPCWDKEKQGKPLLLLLSLSKKKIAR